MELVHTCWREGREGREGGKGGTGRKEGGREGITLKAV